MGEIFHLARLTGRRSARNDGLTGSGSDLTGPGPAMRWIHAKGQVCKPEVYMPNMSRIPLANPAACLASPGLAETTPAPVNISGFAHPESVLIAPSLRYVSNIEADLAPLAKDGDGFISILDADGAIIDLRGLTGLDAPKGMALVGGRLYAADIDRVVGFDPETRDQVFSASIDCPQPCLLNDIVAAGDRLLVSDTLRGQALQMGEHRGHGRTRGCGCPAALQDGIADLRQRRQIHAGDWLQAHPGFGAAGHPEACLDGRAKTIEAGGHQRHTPRAPLRVQRGLGRFQEGAGRRDPDQRHDLACGPVRLTKPSHGQAQGQFAARRLARAKSGVDPVLTHRLQQLRAAANDD